MGSQMRSFQAHWFKEFPWLHYKEHNDSVLCFICAQQNEKSNLKAARNKELIFIEKGFSNWKKALSRFKEHQQSECHKMAISSQMIPKTHKNVRELTSTVAAKQMQQNRYCLLKVIECIQFLGRQGLALQGKTEKESNFLQLFRVMAKNDSILTEWLGQVRDKYTSHDIQNEIIHLMAEQLVQKLALEIKNGPFFSVIADEYTDAANKEQLTICIRWISDTILEVHEDFVGFIQLPNIAAETIFTAILEHLQKLGLSLVNCRGQCFDGASNMLGSKTGVARRIQDIQPKAHITHCHGHSLSLSVKDATKSCKLISSTLDTAKEIATLIKYSPKREYLLGELKENIAIENEEPMALGVLPVCPTRWTVRAKCFRRIIENYEALLQAWEVSLEGSLQSEVRGRIIGCQSQMGTFDFYFGLCLGERLFCHTDNLSETLQKTKMSAVSGQRVAKLTADILQKMRNDNGFKSFYAAIINKGRSLPISEPTLPRKRRVPARFEVGSGAPTYPSSPEDYYRRIYFEALDAIISSIRERFNQPSFQTYMNM